MRFIGNRPGAPTVNINPEGRLCFNKAAYIRYGLTSYSYAVLYFDRAKRIVAIEPTNDESAEGALKFNHYAHGSIIAIRSFLDAFEIDLNTAFVYDVFQDKPTGYVCADLNKGRFSTRKKRRPSPTSD